MGAQHRSGVYCLHRMNTRDSLTVDWDLQVCKVLAHADGGYEVAAEDGGLNGMKDWVGSLSAEATWEVIDWIYLQIAEVSYAKQRMSVSLQKNMQNDYDWTVAYVQRTTTAHMYLRGARKKLNIMKVTEKCENNWVKKVERYRK